MKDLVIVDTHCDTITKLMESKEELYSNSCHLDISRCQKYTGYIQFFAAWIDPYYAYNGLKRSLQIIDEFYRQMNINKDYILPVTSYNEANTAVQKGKVAAFLSIEGGRALEGDIRVLRMLYRLGVRSLCLTWNNRNEIADGVGEKSSCGGLTDFGKEVIKEMNSLGMIVDVSHITPKGFWNVMDTTTQPIIASHSNSKKICSHIRNLDDKQFEAIIKNEGAIGINLCPSFLNDSGEADINDILKHIEHFMSLGGENSIGIGADFDGIDNTPVDIKGVQDIEKIFEKLLRLNYMEEQVKKIAGGNFLRIIKKIFKN